MWFILLLGFIDKIYCSSSKLLKVQKEKVTNIIWIDFMHSDEPVGRIEFGMFTEMAPNAVKYFLSQCSDDKDKNTLISTTVSNFYDYIAGGLQWNHDYYDTDEQYFNDTTRNLKTPLVPGILLYSAKPKNTPNHYTFDYLITVDERNFFDMHLKQCFGKILQGMNVLHEIYDNIETTDEPANVSNCGTSIVDETYIEPTSKTYFF